MLLKNLFMIKIMCKKLLGEDYLFIVIQCETSRSLAFCHMRGDPSAYICASDNIMRSTTNVDWLYKKVLLANLGGLPLPSEALSGNYNVTTYQTNHEFVK